MRNKLPNPQILLKLLQRFTQKELADIFGVNEKTIRRWKNPSNKLKQKRGVKNKIAGDNLSFLLSFTSYRSNYNTLTQQEMVTHLCQERSIIISQQTISRILIREKRTWKKITPRYRELKISEVKNFGETIRHLPLNQFSAIDECHFYLNEAPRYGYAPIGQRAISPTPGSKGGSYSLIIWVKNRKGKGTVHWELTDKTVNTEFFYNFLEKAKSLGEEEDYLIMDNASFHRAPNKRKELSLPSIEEQLSLKNSQLFSLPSRSPMLNPVELLFNTIRHNIEKARAWTPEQLREAISKEMARINQEDLNDYFKKSLQYNLIKLIIDDVKVFSWENWQELKKGITKIDNMNVHPEINEITGELLSIIDEVEIEYKKVDI